MEREAMEFDVVIVGGGPSGLSAAIRLKQLASEAGRDLEVCLIEKGSEVGAHILSGAVLEPRSLNELIPDWKERGAPLDTPVTADKFMFLTETGAMRMPTPPQMSNHGNYIISLGNFCRWLAEQAEALGVEIYPGFAAAEVPMTNGAVCALPRETWGSAATAHRPTCAAWSFGQQTIFAELPRPSDKTLTGSAPEQGPADLRHRHQELWDIDPEGEAGHGLFRPWPLSTDTYGGPSSIPERQPTPSAMLSGLITQTRTCALGEPALQDASGRSRRVRGGRRVAYGARALNEGGFQSIPKLTSRAAVSSAAAGFLNVPKIEIYTADEVGHDGRRSDFRVARGNAARP